ncbi:MAG TPA: N-acetylmuramidase domain-containing protein [Polyangium sp.]|nr:N-acetylmuramidase domain-containing protein [Polyangium sp.]
MNYVVKSGDTLAAIASRHDTTVQAILAANPQIKNPNQIFVGQQIKIPTATPTAPAPQQPTGSTGGTSAPTGTSQGGPPATGPWQLPKNGAARRLAVSDFAAAAKSLGCETAAVRAVADVESGGRTGFDTKKRPKILFEIHLFRDNTKHRYDKSHPHLSAPYSSPRRRASYNRDQWVVIHEAFALDPDAAVKSASWGMFQVLGSNYKMCGWKNVRQFVYDMFESEAQHLRAFLGYCRAANITPYLKTHNWAAFARGYNGPDYASGGYHTKMATAYARYKRQG